MSFRLTHMTALWRRSLACRYPALLSRSRAALRHVPADAATRKFALKRSAAPEVAAPAGLRLVPTNGM
jgi:hypothetical protein